MVKKISVFLIGIVSLFIFGMKINAFEVVKDQTPVGSLGNYPIYNKYTKEDNTPLYCVSGSNFSVFEGSGYSDVTSEYAADDILTIGNIINDSSLSYVQKEQAIFTLLNKEGKETDTTSVVYKAMNNAVAATNVYKTASVQLSSNSLSFTLDASGEYYDSQEVEISTSAIIEDITIAAESGNYGIPYIVTKNNKKSFMVRLSRSEVDELEEIVEVPVNITVIVKSPTVSIYRQTSVYQDLAISNTTTKNLTAQISGMVGQTKPQTSITINKYDSNSIALSGATIKVIGPNGYSQTFVTNGNPIVIDDLEYGTYTIEETIAPAGYIKASKKVVTLSSNNLSSTVNLFNDMTKISVIKYDDDGKTKLQGANLKLVDADGRTINSCPDERSKSFLCEWTTTKNVKIIEGLPAGTYYLVEENAPKGYNLSNDKVEIVISPTGKVTVDGKVSEEGLIEFYNSLTRTEISKISTTDGKELEGATLEILDSKENSISCTIIDADGKDKKLDKCTWVSGKEKTIIKGLEAGSYYLIETIAPEGYELNKNKVEFEVKADGTVTKAQIENNLVVKVPDTLSSRSALLIAISMFDIALGIGILTYVKKNKVQE